MIGKCNTGGGKPEEEKTVTAGTSVIEVLPSSGKTMKQVTINPTPTESKSVTPTASELIVTPSEGKHLSQITVNGDSNLIASNIKKDINIFGVIGTLKPEPPNGTDWTKSNITYTDVRLVHYANGIWVAASGSGLYYSTDGMTWTQSSITSGGFESVYYANGLWVSGGYNNEGLYYSTDGMTWTQSNITTDDIRSIYYANGIWVADKYYSTNGRTWTDTGIPMWDVYYANGLWVGSSNSTVYYSIDGKTWSESTLTMSHLSSIYYGNGIWVAGSRDNGLYYSTDGMTWTQSNITSGHFISVYYANNTWMACSWNRDGIYYSLAPIEKTAFGIVKITTTNYLTIEHNLGVKPKWFVALGTTDSSSYTHGCAYNESSFNNYVYVQGGYYTTPKTVSDTKGSTSYAYIDESVITVPYYNSSYPWYNSDNIIWAVGY